MLAEFERDNGKHESNEQRHQRLDLAVSVGMLLVRRRVPVLHADDDGNVGDHVRRGMHGVREQRLGVPGDAADELQHGNDDVHRHPRVSHLPNIVCRFRHIRPDCRLLYRNHLSITSGEHNVTLIPDFQG